MDTLAPSPVPTSIHPLLSKTGVIAVSTIGAGIIFVLLVGGLWFNRKYLWRRWKRYKSGKRTMVVPVNTDLDAIVPISPPPPTPAPAPVPEKEPLDDTQPQGDNQNIRIWTSEQPQQADVENHHQKQQQEDEVVMSIISDKPTQEIPKTLPANPITESPTAWENLPPEVVRTKPTVPIIAESPTRVSYHAAQAAKKVSIVVMIVLTTSSCHMFSLYISRLSC